MTAWHVASISNKDVRDLVREVIRNNPGTVGWKGRGSHHKIKAPGLPMMTVAASPGKTNHVKQARKSFLIAGYKLDRSV